MASTPTPSPAIEAPLTAGPNTPGPPPASNPPNDFDVLQAELYVRHVMHVRAFIVDDDIGDNIVADALRYAFQILARFCGFAVAPPGPGLRQRVDDIERRLTGILISQQIRVTVLENLTRGSGMTAPLGEVHFPDGSRPTEHALPLLTSAAIVDGLTDEQTNQYYQRYYPNWQLAQAGPYDVRKGWIKKAIGCLFEF